MKLIIETLKGEWGTFTPFHIFTILVTLSAPFILYFALRKKSMMTQKITLFILSLSGTGAIIYNLLMWGSSLEYLPFHLCSINALLLPISIITSSRLLASTLPLFSIGAFAAIALNYAQGNYVILSWVFAVYFFPHMLEFAIPFVQLKLGLVKTGAKYIFPSVGMTFLFYTVAHFVNRVVNKVLDAQEKVDSLGEPVSVNYMYSLDPEGLPILSQLWDICPCEYFYMLLLLPLVLLIYSSMNYKEIFQMIALRRSGSIR